MSQFCPKCKVKARCVDSRHDIQDCNVYRRFCCDACGCRFTSKEFVTAIDGVEIDAPKDRLAELSAILLKRLESQGYVITRPYRASR